MSIEGQENAMEIDSGKRLSVSKLRIALGEITNRVRPPSGENAKDVGQIKRQKMEGVAPNDGKAELKNAPSATTRETKHAPTEVKQDVHNPATSLDEKCTEDVRQGWSDIYDVIEPSLKEYCDTIMQTHRANELKYQPNSGYMERVQRDVDHNMRGLLIDWLAEVASEYKLLSQTLFLTVSFIDRILTLTSVHRTKLQLIGITCMHMAAKYEEIYPPSLDDFVYVADQTYSRHEVLAMELVILKKLDWRLTNSTVWIFTLRMTTLCQYDPRAVAMVNFITELTLQEPVQIQHLPSKIASSACFLTLLYIGQNPWPAKLYAAAKWPLAELEGCIDALHLIYRNMYEGKSTLKAVKNKYSDQKWHRVALVVPPTSIKAAYAKAIQQQESYNFCICLEACACGKPIFKKCT